MIRHRPYQAATTVRKHSKGQDRDGNPKMVQGSAEFMAKGVLKTGA